MFFCFLEPTRWKSEETPCEFEVKWSPVGARLGTAWCPSGARPGAKRITPPLGTSPLPGANPSRTAWCPWCTARSIALRDSKQIQIGQPAKRQVSSWRAGVGRGSTGTPGGGRSRGGQARAPGRAVVGRETENGPGRCWVRNPGGPWAGGESRTAEGAAPVRAGNPKGSGGGRGSGGESQGLRGRAKVGREHQGHLRRAGDPRSTWGGRGERIVGRSWVAGGGGGEGNTYRQNSNAVKESFWDSQGVRLRRGDSWTELEVAEGLGGR